MIADASAHPQLGHLDVPSLRRPTTSNPEERGHVTPGKYVVLDSDRVNCRQTRCRTGSCWSISPAKVSKVTRGNSTSPYAVKHPEALS